MKDAPSCYSGVGEGVGVGGLVGGGVRVEVGVREGVGVRVMVGVGEGVVSAITCSRASVRHAAGTASAGRASRASQSRLACGSCPIFSSEMARQ